MNYRIGVDLGGTGIKAGVVDENFNIVCRESAATDAARRGFEQVVEDMVRVAEKAAAQIGLTLSDFPCVGVGTPSCISPKTGLLVFSNNTNWRNVPLRQELEKRIAAPVLIGNDANCAVVGECVAGAAKGYRDVVMFTLGTGVGSGIVIGGKMYAGADGMGAELGHTPLIYGGEPCTCGANGCAESYASVTGLIRDTKRAMERHPESAMHAHAALHGAVSGRTAFDCAKEGDLAALEVAERYCDYVAAVIAGAVSVFRPEIVLIGGGVSNAGAFLLDRLNERAVKRVFAGEIIGCAPIAAARLGNDAGIVGAAYLDQW
ncbi:MAG: ROK family protein [Clostridiaceae bacterium]|nr:ROK family protein [Eubacteriales bacterium]